MKITKKALPGRVHLPLPEQMPSKPTVHKLESLPRIPQRLRVAAYCRVSAGNDATAHSLSAQVSHYSQHIQNHAGWEYAGVFADEAYTGTKDDRPAFQMMLAECRAGRIDRILTKSISRFARNTVTLLETVRELKTMGIAVYFEEQNIDSLSGDGELMLTILASFAQAESESVSENCKWRICRDFAEGKPMHLPRVYGYKQADGAIVIHEEEAAIVRRIFRDYLRGVGSARIAASLREEKVPTRKGGEWRASGIIKMLRNEKYTGNSLLQKTFTDSYLTKKRLINRGQLPQYYAEATHPAIISMEDFEQVQALLARRSEQENVKKPTTARYPLSRLVVCGRCGAHFNRHTTPAGKETQPRVVWQCFTYLTKGKSACPSKHIPEETLLELTREALDVPCVTEETVQALAEIRMLPDDNGVGEKTTHLMKFVFKDGRTIEKTWEERTRASWWTDERRKKAGERMKEIYKKWRDMDHE